jgi:hypothetical protein
MSEEAREKKALALLDYIESKQALAILRDKLSENGQFLVTVGTALQTDPAQYAWNKYIIFQDQIDEQVREWQELTDKTEQLRQKVASFGLAV